MLNRVGLRPPGVQVRFQDLTVYANIHVGSRATPTVLNSYRNAVEVSLCLHAAIGMQGSALERLACCSAYNLRFCMPEAEFRGSFVPLQN